MKYYRMSYEEVTKKRAYINIMLLNAAIPGMKPTEKGQTGKGNASNKKVHANDFFSQLM